MSKREKGLKSERRGKKQKPLMLGMHKGSLPPFPVGLPPPVGLTGLQFIKN